MNRIVAISGMWLFFALMMSGAIARREGRAWPDDLTIVSAIFCLPFAHRCLSMTLAQRKLRKIKLGSETLPQIAEITDITVDGIPISDTRKKMLIEAMSKAKRAAACGKVVQDIPCQIHDQWGDCWSLNAYEDDQGNRGFSVNRVYYSGPEAKIVAECVGLRR